MIYITLYNRLVTRGDEADNEIPILLCIIIICWFDANADSYIVCYLTNPINLSKTSAVYMYSVA